jgi:hypothetical protein
MSIVGPVSRSKPHGHPRAKRQLALRDVGVAASIVLLGTAIANAQECLTSCLSGHASESWQACSPAVSDRRTVGHGWPRDAYNFASYDLRLAIFQVHTNVPNPGMAAAAVIAADRFRIVGPASDTPLAVTVRLHVTTDGCETHAGLWEGEGSLSDFVPITIWPESVLEIEVRRRPGEDFDLRYGGRLHYDSYDIEAGGADCNLRGRLDFVAIPPGYSIESCQGYSARVAVAPATWTHAKMLYRN